MVGSKRGGKNAQNKVNIWMMLTILLGIGCVILGYLFYYYYQESSSMLQSLNKQIQEINAEHENVISTYQEKISSSEREISELETQIAGCKDEIEGYKEEIAERDEKIAGYQEKIDDYEKGTLSYRRYFGIITKYLDNYLGYCSSSLYSDKSIYILEEDQNECTVKVHMAYDDTICWEKFDDFVTPEWSRKWNNNNTDLNIQVGKKGVYVVQIHDKNNHGFNILVIKK